MSLKIFSECFFLINCLLMVLPSFISILINKGGIEENVTGKNHVFTVLGKARINDTYIRAVNLVLYMYLHWIYCPLKDSKYSRY